MTAWFRGLALAAVLTASSSATAQPVYDVLHAFARPPEQPQGAPVEAEPGVFYGTTAAGGPGNGGVVFRLAIAPSF